MARSKRVYIWVVEQWMDGEPKPFWGPRRGFEVKGDAVDYIEGTLRDYTGDREDWGGDLPKFRLRRYVREGA